MKHKTIFVGLILGLAVSQVQAGVFDQFEDIEVLIKMHMLSGGPGKDGIPAMTNPEFVDPDQVEYVRDDELVMGVYMHGEVKAYPENLGWWHEIVNDQIGDQFISVTLCPLTGTGMVFNATDADGSQIEFGVSGFLINTNLVMYDRRNDRTLYPQMIYTGLNDDFKNQQLELLPVVETTWGMWKQMYPETKVAQFGTGLERYSERKQQSYLDVDRFRSYPYGNYRTDNNNLFLYARPTSSMDLRTLEVKDVVLGLCQNDQLKAYPFPDMPDGAVINDELGGVPLLVVFEREASLAIPFYREVDGQVLTFYEVEPEGNLPVEFMDAETRSRWNLRGEAVSGPLAGQRLRQMPGYNSMWFAWATYWPETDLWTFGEGIIEPPPTTVEEEDIAALPEHFVLSQNYPNPFNPTTHIQYALPQDGLVRLSVYNAAGQKIRTLVDGYRAQGLYLQDWDGRDESGAQVSSGTYLYRLEMPEQGLCQTRSMTLMR